MNGPGLRAGATLVAAVALAALVVLGFRWGGTYIPAASSGSGAAWLDFGFTVALFGALGAAGLAGIHHTCGLAGLLGPRTGRMAISGGAVGAIALLLAFLYARLAGTAVRVPAATGHGIVAFLIGSVAVAVQASAEETYFRGWLQRALARDWPPAAALIGAAGAFSLLHLLGGARAPISLLNIFLAGVLFGLLADRTRGLAAPLAAHAAYNWTETLLLGLDPNPGTGSFGALWDYDLAGPAIWGGSSEGLNASFGLCAALVALIVPLLFVQNRARASAPL